MTNNKDMELRSEKVRNIVGQMPSYILRAGIYVISIILLSLLLISCLVSYNEYEIVLAELHCRPAYQIGKMSESGNFYIVAYCKNVYKDQCIGYIKTAKDSMTVLYSYVNGKITFNCRNGDYMKKHDVIFSIIPDTINQTLAIFHITSDKIGKIKMNQEVVFRSAAGDDIKGYISCVYPVQVVDSLTNNSSYKIEATLEHDKNVSSFKIEVSSMKILISRKMLLKKILSF